MVDGLSRRNSFKNSICTHIGVLSEINQTKQRMKYIGIGLLTGIIGYVIIAFLSYVLIDKFSSNSHDRGMEAVMTSVFVYGPIGFIVFFSRTLLFWGGT
jgi:Na+/melibiose symporter-like transporter